MEFIILGCGSSMGVPRPDGFFGNCDPKNKKNYRTRCSALLKTTSETILFDTSPDLRKQLIDNKIDNISKVFYSHMHADQTHGINDLRVFFLKNRKTIPVFADTLTKKYLLKTFNYCFVNHSKEYPAILKFNNLKKNQLLKNGSRQIKLKAIEVDHGKIKCICYIIDNRLAYISDVSSINKKYFNHFKNLDYLVLDCLWIREHSSHLNLEDALKLIKEFKPKKSILTNLHSDLDYQKLKDILPKNVIPAYDGLRLKLK